MVLQVVIERADEAWENHGQEDDPSHELMWLRDALHEVEHELVPSFRDHDAIRKHATTNFLRNASADLGVFALLNEWVRSSGL